MQIPESPRPRRSKRPLLLIHNLFNYGHFLVYADTLTQWALSRGFRVALLGRGLRGSGYQLRYQGVEHVEILDVDPDLRLDPLLAAQSKAGLAVQAGAEILEAQQKLQPEATILLSTDELLFHAEHVLPPGFAFPTPTVGLVTFGHRDCYLGHADLYAQALNRALAARSPFRAVLTLDEYQVAALDPGQEHLVFLPDIYCNPPGADNGAVLSGRDATDLVALLGFLDHASGPVLPLLGKLDRRKNPLWVLEAVRDTPGASCVVLGQRVPDPDDPEANARYDALLAELSAQGRAFVRLGYVPEPLFRLALGHARTPFLPLPYACHYGSSGPQLQAFAAGKPTLIPDVGLMAWRVQAHGLGECYAHGDERDFRRAFAGMLAQGQEPYAENIRRFMACFTPVARDLQLDLAFGLLPSGADLLPRLTEASLVPPRAEQLRQGLDLARAGRLDEALEQYAKALAQNPRDAVALLRQALALDELGRYAEAHEALRQCLDNGGAQEFIFVLLAQFACVDALLEGVELGDRRRHFDATPLLAHAAEFSGSRGKGWLDRFDADFWVRVCDALVQTGRFEAAAAAYRTLLELTPEAHEFWLNLSDVLRYVGRLDESDAALDALAAAAPQHPGLHHKRGQVLFERGSLDEAEAEFRREPQDSPHVGPAQNYLERIAARRSG